MSGSLWLLQLQPASFAGLSFSVDSSEVARGRRIAVHEYPFRDDVWGEDIGRGTRSGAFSGFIVGDTCYAQAKKMLAKAETKGLKTLVHPSLGSLSVVLTAPLRALERKELGRVVELQFEYVESGKPSTPVGGLFAQIQAGIAAVAADVAVVTDFVSSVRAGIDQGLLTLRIGVGLVSAWVSEVENVGEDAALITDAVAGLPGNFGRYSAASGSKQPASIGTASAAIGNVVAARAAVAAAGAQAVASMSALSVSGSTDNGTCAAIQATTEALRAACVSPADAVRLLTSLAGYQPLVVTSSAPIGAALAAMQTATGQIFRRAALTSLARACGAYQPSSYDDAIAVRNAVAIALGAEILGAADAEQDASYQALRALRSLVLQDLTARGADLARLALFEIGATQPSLTLAYRLYRDATRSDDLIARVNPPHPAFMPPSFTALSS